MSEGGLRKFLADCMALPDRMLCSVSHGRAHASISWEIADHPYRTALERDVRGPGGTRGWILAVRFDPGNVVDSFEPGVSSDEHLIRWLVSAVTAVLSFRIRRRTGGGWAMDRGIVKFGESRMTPEKAQFIKGCVDVIHAKRSARDVKIAEFPEAGRVRSVKNLKVRFEAVEQRKDDMRHIEEFLEKIWARRARGAAA